MKTLRTQIEEILDENGIYIDRQKFDDFMGDASLRPKLLDQILTAIRVELEAKLPKEMYFNAVYVSNDELNNKIAEGYNQALADYKANLERLFK